MQFNYKKLSESTSKLFCNYSEIRSRMHDI